MLKLPRRTSAVVQKKKNEGSSDVPSPLQKADKARDIGDWAGAVAGYMEHLEANPDDAGIWVQLGNCAKEARDFKRSAQAYQRALELAPEMSDTHLQIGHLHKVMGDLPGALGSYLKSLDYPPLNLDAIAELERAGWGDEANRVAVRSNETTQRTENLLVFDITDLVMYIGNHDNLSGIQRVQCCVLQAIIKYDLYDARDVRFVSHDRQLRAFRSINPERLLALLDDLALPKAQRKVEFDSSAARHGQLYPDEPLALFLRPGRTTFVLLGAAWVIPEYPSLIANLKRNFDARFVMLFHDFIPIYARETCDQGTAIVFKDFVDQIIPLTDYAMCVSRSTQADLARYCVEIGSPAPPSSVTRLGSSFDEFFPVVQVADRAKSVASEDIPSEPYVLLVSTIEGRKNHNYVFEIWRHLVQNGVAVPRLVCVGRLGWRAEAFLRNLLESDYLDGLIEIREDVSDQELDALYQGCKFTIFPSIYEGWGLPIGESLGHGKLCVLANNSSLPEVAGEFGCTISLDDVPSAGAVIADLLENPERLRCYEQSIAEGFKPERWEEVARVVIDACAKARTVAGVSGWPSVDLGVEYPIKRLRSSFEGLVGPLLLETMKEYYASRFTGKLTRSADRIKGILARDGRWYECEDWGTWARGGSANLKLALDRSAIADGQTFLFYGAFEFGSGMKGAEIDLKIGEAALDDPYVIKGVIENVAWEVPSEVLLRHGVLQDDGRLQLSIGFEISGVTDDGLAQSLKVDPRGLMFGLASFLMLDAADFEQRLMIAENSLLSSRRKQSAHIV